MLDSLAYTGSRVSFNAYVNTCHLKLVYDYLGLCLRVDAPPSFQGGRGHPGLSRPAYFASSAKPT